MRFQSAIRNPQFAIVAALLATGPWLLAPGYSQDDPFAAGVRTTPWLSPADEQKAFKLPAGFEINLVAAEPEIQKPLNMAFDERGRIWLACTVEYPYAAPPDRPGKDSIRVLEDTDGDGRFEKVTTFADKLNIPIGIYPYKGGCIAYSIPNIWRLEDTDGDGTCDKRTVLYGPFDTSRDTHGMVNSFRRGFDGWIYACHGFNNDSRVKGKDGNEVHMSSGNTFRFQLDGSRIEHFTHGQVNPFGMCFDELFNIFTADCHSKPLTQLLRGGYYPSFGKPHDGLGFVPSMMEHSHGSTAICGVAIYTGENFPPEYRGLFYSGNVMTSRINCNKPEYHGSTIKAIEQPDFLSTSDPWFRPVDIHVGPDGAMYILDFYNRIIGHYEVPLPHPGRDRTSGRIWRIVYTRPNDKDIFPVEMPADLVKFTNAELIQSFGERNDRIPALSVLRERGRECVPEIKVAWNNPSNSQSENIQLLWLLEHYGELSDGVIQQTMWHSSRWEGTHLMRILSERKDWNEFQRATALSALSGQDEFVARAAADAIGRHPKPGQIWPLIARLEIADHDDTHLRHSIRLALRDHLAGLDSPAVIEALQISDGQRRTLAEICLGVKNSTAAALLIREIESSPSGTDLNACLQHAARYCGIAEADRLIRITRQRARNEAALQAQLVLALASGIAQRQEQHVPALTTWAEQVATELLQATSIEQISWTAVPIDGLPPSENPWVIAARPSRDGDTESLFFYSLPKGEQRTGNYRSGAFELPGKLSFWCAGHSGLPGQPLNKGNYVRLRDGKTHELLAESRPPRNDTARRFEWDLSKFAGKQGYVELVDGDMGNAYAWLAVGRFSLPALNPGLAAGRQQLAAEIVGKLKLTALKPQLTSLVAAANTDRTARAAIGQALVAMKPDARAAALAAALADPQLPAGLQTKIGQAIADDANEAYVATLREVMKQAPARFQATLADALAGDTSGAAALIAVIESGHAAPRLLLLPNVKNKLAALGSANLDQGVLKITTTLPPASEIIDRALVERRAAFAKATTNLERGALVFTKHCAGCHQIVGKGAVVGPQLDGIGLRGLDRLLEDTLDPNRNVDVAFRTTTIRTKDGQVLTGLVRREEGPQLVLADAQGKEFTVAKSEIDAQLKTALSLMPANVAEVVPAEEFLDLVAYLLSQRAAKSE